MKRYERAFHRDHRDNDGLHRLYVGYALQEIRVAQAAIAELEGFSRLSASAMAQALRVSLREEIMNDAAWFEAAALLNAGADTNEFEYDNQKGK